MWKPEAKTEQIKQKKQKLHLYILTALTALQTNVWSQIDVNFSGTGEVIDL